MFVANGELVHLQATVVQSQCRLEVKRMLIPKLADAEYINTYLKTACYEVC